MKYYEDPQKEKDERFHKQKALYKLGYGNRETNNKIKESRER